ncbi:MAG: sigma-54 dependent transcriptional regulator [Candidatus Eisenbacteria bacterium]
MRDVLVIEDQATLREAIVEAIGEVGLDVAGAGTAKDGLAAFEADPSPLVLTDLRLEEPESGLTLVREIRGRSPQTEVLLMTAFGTVEVAVEAMKAGAFDFLQKPFSLDHLLEKVRKVWAIIEERKLADRERDAHQLLRDEVDDRWGGEIVGQSPVMLDLFRKIDKVASASSSVLVLGESGSGKELVARAIHARSPRQERPFVRVNCGALAEGVLESELFGHEKGAFTGAVKQRRGRFELAEGGTILLDEIGEVPLATQVRLLRVLQERQLERVGGEETLDVDVRVIAATNRDLKAEVAAGRFREDLFYRLYVIPLEVPPLRDRPDDIPLLVEYFIRRICRDMGRSPVAIDPEASNLLRVYRWPGNVRELENVVERAIVLCEDEVILPRDLPFVVPEREPDVTLGGGFPPLREVVERVERQMIERAMNTAHGVKTEAARLLDLKPSVLYYKLEKYGWKDSDTSPDAKAPETTDPLS